MVLNKLLPEHSCSPLAVTLPALLGSSARSVGFHRLTQQESEFTLLPLLSHPFSPLLPILPDKLMKPKGTWEFQVLNFQLSSKCLVNMLTLSRSGSEDSFSCQGYEEVFLTGPWSTPNPHAALALSRVATTSPLTCSECWWPLRSLKLSKSRSQHFWRPLPPNVPIYS